MRGKLPDLKLLIIAAYEGIGGAHLDKLIPSLHSMGIRLAFAGWDRSRRYPDRFAKDGVSFQMIFKGFGFENRSVALGLPWWMIKSWFYLCKNRYDCVMALDFGAGLPMAVANLLTGVPYIYNIRDNFAMRKSTPKKLALLIQKLDDWVISRAYKVIIPDENRITGNDPLVRKKFVIVRNCAIDVSASVPACLPSRPFTIYAMGYLTGDRGIGILLEAARRLPMIRVLLAGNLYDKMLKDRIEQAENAQYLGLLPPEEALKYCFESDLIFTYYSPDSDINLRAVSNKWSDAMMASKPILLNEEVFKSTWIKQEDIGYLCPYGDVDRLVELIDHIRSHPEEACIKGEKGRKLYDSGYSWPAMEGRFRTLLEEFMTDHEM